MHKTSPYGSNGRERRPNTLDTSDLEPFFISHVHLIYRNTIRDDMQFSLSSKSFYIHNTNYTRVTNGTSTEIVHSKEQIEYMIEKAMGGKVMHEQGRAKYIVCDDISLEPRLKTKQGQIFVTSDYIFSRVSDIVL
jgi:hypothetical protein